MYVYGVELRVGCSVAEGGGWVVGGWVVGVAYTVIGGDGEETKKKKRRKGCINCYSKSGKESEGWCNKLDVDCRASAGNHLSMVGKHVAPRGIRMI